MADKLRQYADWLVANQNRRGTPEFETVANAYKQLRQQSQQPQATSNPIVGFAQRGVQLGANLSNTAELGLDQLSNVAEDYGYPKISDALETGADYAQAIQDTLQNTADDFNYQPAVPWNEVKSNPSVGNVLTFMGESAITSLPDMAMALLSTPLYFSTYVAPIAEERAKNDGRSEVTPKDIMIALGSSAAIAGAERFGAKGVFGKGVSGNVLTRPVKAGVKEAGTEALQNPIEYAGGTVGTEAGFDAAVAGDQALAGAVGGFGAGTGLRTVNELTGVGSEQNRQAVADAATKAGDVLNPALIGYDQQAAADLGQRLQRISKANDLNLKNVSKSSTTGAREAIDKAHIQISEELKQLARDLRQQLGIKDSDSEAIVFDKVMAIAGQRQARNKAKSTVGVGRDGGD